MTGEAQKAFREHQQLIEHCLKWWATVLGVFLLIAIWMAVVVIVVQTVSD